MFAVILTSLASFTNIEIVTPPVEYPEGYRNWTHVKTAIVGPKSPAYPHFGGFHHIYANEKAMKGYSTGIFPNGSILVFDVLEATEKDTDVLEGKRRIVDVMVKDSQKYSDTGGWGFEEFEGDSKTQRNIKEQANSQCFSCHKLKKEKDFVFSEFRP